MAKPATFRFCMFTLKWKLFYATLGQSRPRGSYTAPVNSLFKGMKKRAQTGNREQLEKKREQGDSYF